MLSKISTAGKTIFIIIVSITVLACGDSDSGDKKIKVLSPDSAASFQKSRILEFAKHKLGDIKFYEFGNFQPDSTFGLVAGTELASDTSFGIRFHFIKRENREFKIVYESPLLDGSFNEAITRKIKVGSTEYDLLYYSSQDYFMGSGGGEIYSYIIDLSLEQVYYAHFITVKEKPTSLYLSPNISSESIREFFILNFRKDYPDLNIVNRDYSLENIF